MSGDLLFNHWVSPKTETDRLTVSPENMVEIGKRLEGESQQVWSDLPLFGETSASVSGESKSRGDLFKTLYNEGTILDHMLDLPGISSILRTLPHHDRFAAISKEKRHLLLPMTPHTRPTMVVHGRQDKQVPFAEGLKTWDDLGENGVERECQWFEGGGHEVADPERMEMRREEWEMGLETVLGWLEGVLRRFTGRSLSGCGVSLVRSPVFCQVRNTMASPMQKLQLLNQKLKLLIAESRAVAESLTTHCGSSGLGSRRTLSAPKMSPELLLPSFATVLNRTSRMSTCPLQQAISGCPSVRGCDRVNHRWERPKGV